MTLEGLSTEILLTILECLLSPLDLISIIRASPVLYRTFITYKQHLLRHTLHRAIHPACRVDVYTALDAQNIPKLIKSREALTKVKAECFLLFANDRTRRQKNDQFGVDDNKLETLFYLHANIERLIDKYCHWSLGNLHWHHEKPKPFDANTIAPRANLSGTERARLQRAFYRCEIYARFRRVLHLLDQSSALNFSQIVLSFVSQFSFYEFEEIVSVQQFLAQFVQSLCEKVEDDLITSCSPNRPPETNSRTQSTDEAPAPIQNQYPGDLSFFKTSHRESHRADHVKFLISCGLPHLLHLGHLDPTALKHAILQSDTDSRKNKVTDFFSQDGLDIDACDENQKNTVLRGKLVSIPRDDVGGMNLGWIWGTSFHDFVKPDSPAMFDLRNQGYVFWDQGRLRESGLVEEPLVVCVGANYFPPGHKGPFSRPSVEERLSGLEVDYEVMKKWREK